MSNKTRIVAQLIKLAKTPYVEPERPYYPYSVTDLNQDPEYKENDYPIQTDCEAYYSSDGGKNGKPCIGFPVATNESNNYRAPEQADYSYDINALEQMLKHERTHGDTMGINPLPIRPHNSQMIAEYDVNPEYNPTEYYYDPVRESEYLQEYPSIVQEQLHNAPNGWITPITVSNNLFRGTEDSKNSRIDGYYNSIFPENREVGRQDRRGWQRKAYHTPLPFYVNSAGRVVESPYDTFNLSLFNSPQKITDMPIGYQKAVDNFRDTRKAKQQFNENPVQYREQQQRIQNGLLPLATRIPYNTYNSADYKLPKDNTNSRIQPIPIGLPGMQTKHFITPWFNRPTDTRTTQQMDKIENDISHSYKLDKHLRQNFQPNGINSAGV